MSRRIKRHGHEGDLGRGGVVMMLRRWARPVKQGTGRGGRWAGLVAPGPTRQHRK
jgi:hypothetical protein